MVLGGCASHRAGTVQKNPNTVFVLGSLHSLMLTHRSLSLPVFTKAMELYHPDLILTEVRDGHDGAAEGAIDGGIEQSIVYAYAKTNGVEVAPIDWVDEKWLADFLEYSKKPHPILDAHLKPYEEKYAQMIKDGTFRELHSDHLENLIREMYEVGARYGDIASKFRNEKICENLKRRLINEKGRRILVIFGLEHRFSLNDCIRESGAFILSTENWLGGSNLDISSISPEIRNLSILNIEAAKKLLQERLDNGFYAEPNKSRMKQKIDAFTRWREKLRTL